MIYRSKAPLRIGLAGGGTDVSPYSDRYGGAILNATISLSAYATIELLKEDRIIVEALDRNENQAYDLRDELPINGQLDLLKGVYNRVQKDFKTAKTGFRYPHLWTPRLDQDWVLPPPWSLQYWGHLPKCIICPWANMIWPITPMRLKGMT